jgi:hypothetical protein
MMVKLTLPWFSYLPSPNTNKIIRQIFFEDTILEGIWNSLPISQEANRGRRIVSIRPTWLLHPLMLSGKYLGKELLPVVCGQHALLISIAVTCVSLHNQVLIHLIEGKYLNRSNLHLQRNSTWKCKIFLKCWVFKWSSGEHFQSLL